MDSTFHIAYRDDASLFMHNMKMCRPGLQTLTLQKYLRFGGLVQLRRQWPGVGRKD